MIRINFTQTDKEEGRGSFCTKSLRGFYDKITDKNLLFSLCVIFLGNYFGC